MKHQKPIRELGNRG